MISKKQKFNYSLFMWFFQPVLAFFLVVILYYSEGKEIIWNNIIQDTIWKATLMLAIWIPMAWLLFFKLDLLNKINNLLKE